MSQLLTCQSGDRQQRCTAVITAWLSRNGHVQVRCHLHEDEPARIGRAKPALAQALTQARAWVRPQPLTPNTTPY